VWQISYWQNGCSGKGVARSRGEEGVKKVGGLFDGEGLGEVDALFDPVLEGLVGFKAGRFYHRPPVHGAAGEVERPGAGWVNGVAIGVDVDDQRLVTPPVYR
jgi:hypothetical protein